MTNNIICVSDIHAGCRMALCPKEGIKLDGGGTYLPSPIQRKLYQMWENFWQEWVPLMTKKEKFVVVVNGDVIDGRHHSSTTQVSQNLADQSEAAYTLLKPIVDLCEGKFYMVRGTEAHVGQSGEEEEKLARRLGAVANTEGQHSHYEIRMQVGKKHLVHFSHHIGTTGSMAYETSAVMKEIEQMFVDAARWGRQIPDVIVRSHRHRHVEARTPTQNGYGIGFVTAAWQLKTPFAYRVAGGRIAQPQIGGSLIRHGDRETFTAHQVHDIEPPPTIVP